MKTFDVLYHWNEPPSFGALALADAQTQGAVKNAIAMPVWSGEQVFAKLKSSSADAVAFVSPAQYGEFFQQFDLRSLGKPLFSFATEWCHGNPISEYREFQDSCSLFDAYACGQECDARAMREMGRRAFVSSLWISSMAFRPGPSLRQRKQKLVFIGDTNEYRPGVYAERRRMVAALQKHGLLDVVAIPKHITTAHQVAAIYANYAGVFCPSSNGRAQGIRVYEAAASGALVVEAQPMEQANEFFKADKHRLALSPDISDQELCDIVAGLRFEQWQDAALAAAALAQSYSAAAVLQRIADTAV